MSRQYNVQGANQYSVLASSLIGAGSYPFSLSFWFQQATPTGGTPAVLLSFQDAAFSNALTIYSFNNFLVMDTEVGGVGGTPVAVPGAIVPKFGLYSATLVAASATDRRLYLGALGSSVVIGVTDTASAVLGSLAGTVIGSALVSGVPFDPYVGVIDELAVWNVALSYPEVKMVATRLKSGFQVRTTKLTHFIRLGYGPNGVSASLDLDMIGGVAFTNVGAVFDWGKVPPPAIFKRPIALAGGFSLPTTPPTQRPAVVVCS